MNVNIKFQAILLIVLIVGTGSIARAQESVEPDSTNSTRDKNNSETEAVAAEDNEAEPDNSANTRAPGSFDIDEEAAIRALERSLIQINALLLPPGKVELSLNTSFGSDARESPLIVPIADPNDASQTVNTLGVSQVERRSYEAALNMSIGLPFDTQLGLNIPFKASNVFSGTAVNGLISEQSNFSIAGIGDMNLSLLKTVIKEKGRRPDVIARFSIDLDTGDNNNDGLSTGSDSVEYTFALNATKRQDPLVFTYQLSHTIAAENKGFKAGDATQISLGTILAASPYTSVKFSFSQSILGKSEINGESIDQSFRAPATVSLGTSSIVGRSVFIFTDVTTGINNAASDYTLRIGISRQFSVF